MVNPVSHWQSSIRHAFELAETMSSEGHQVNAVFFYGQAVRIVQSTEQLNQWQLWQQSTQTPLLLCSNYIENYQLAAQANQTKGFEPVSMGRWVQAAETADKIVELC